MKRETLRWRNREREGGWERHWEYNTKIQNSGPGTKGKWKNARSEIYSCPFIIMLLVRDDAAVVGLVSLSLLGHDPERIRRLNKIHFDNLFIENRKILCSAFLLNINGSFSWNRMFSVSFCLFLVLVSSEHSEPTYMRSKRFRIYGFSVGTGPRRAEREKIENLPEKDINWIRSIPLLTADVLTATLPSKRRRQRMRTCERQINKTCMHKMRHHRSGVGVEFINKFASGLFDSFSESIALHNSRLLGAFAGFFRSLSSSTSPSLVRQFPKQCLLLSFFLLFFVFCSRSWIHKYMHISITRNDVFKLRQRDTTPNPAKLDGIESTSRLTFAGSPNGNVQFMVWLEYITRERATGMANEKQCGARRWRRNAVNIVNGKCIKRKRRHRKSI